MKCRCGHGRSSHWATQKGRKGFADRQRRGQGAQVLHLPCHTIERVKRTRPLHLTGPGGVQAVDHWAMVQCGCRDWHPVQEGTPR